MYFCFPDQCKLPIERGSCAGNFGRWGFNAETRRCEQFIWGGCEGNSNRFGSEAACVMRCNPPGQPQREFQGKRFRNNLCIYLSVVFLTNSSNLSLFFACLKLILVMVFL